MATTPTPAPDPLEQIRDLEARFASAMTQLYAVGNGLADSATILQHAGVEMDGDAIIDHLTDRVRDMLSTHGVPFRPGARELLRDLQDAGIPTALSACTRTVRRRTWSRA